MTLFARTALATLAAIGVAPVTHALAADYEPPVIAGPAPEVPVEVGTGWYLRGDVGYNLNKSFKNVDFGLTPVSYSEDENQFSGSLGFGYHFTDWLRADLDLGYLPGNKISGSYDDGVIDASAEVKNSSWYGMANVYADLGTYVGLTPYIGAGAGILRSNPSVVGHYDDGVTDVDFHDHSPDYSFAYTFNAGLSYAITHTLSVDLGYQYLAAPSAKWVTLNDPASYSTHEGMHYHQIRLGLRYDLW